MYLAANLLEQYSDNKPIAQRTFAFLRMSGNIKVIGHNSHQCRIVLYDRHVLQLHKPPGGTA